MGSRYEYIQATRKVHHIPQRSLIRWHLVYISVSWLAQISPPKLIQCCTLTEMKILNLQNCEPDPHRMAVTQGPLSLL